MRKKVFGFDLGIASIGWAVVNFDDEKFDLETGEVTEGEIKGCGVRCFPVAENPKDGSSLAAPRRAKRLLRRITRRKARRMEGIKRLFAAKGLVASVEELDRLYAAQVGGDVWNLRVKALDEKLSREELARVLTHLAKHRGFKSYRKAAEEADKESGKILQAIKANKEAMGNHYRTLAEMIVGRVQNSETRKMRNYTAKDSKNKDVPVYINSIPREKIIEETKLIFESQKKYGLFTEDLYHDFCRIAFRFREAGSVGKMVGKCRFEPDEFRAPKEAPSAELFVAMSKINNMRITIDGERRFLNSDERAALLELLKNTREVKYSTIRNKMFKGREMSFEDVDYNKKTKKDKEGNEKEINPEDVKFYSMKGWHKLKAEFSPEDWSVVSQDLPLLDIGMTAVACEKNDDGIENCLKEKGVDAKYREVFKKLDSKEFINLSLKALYKINPYMAGGMKYHEACEKAGYDFRDGDEKLADKKGLFLPPIAADKQTTVPVVNRTIAQLRKVYNAMVRTYGAPDQINLEVGRELRKTHDERQQIKQRQEQYADERSDAAAELEKMQISVTGKNILKYRLYQQQHGKCIYSGKQIDINRLGEDGYCEVDHIIPYSRSLDDSMNNKVLCFREENQKKGSKTPYEYLSSDRWEDFKTIITTTPSLGKKKRDNLLNDKYAESENDLEFRERNANDNSYIARYAKQYLEDAIDFSASACPIKQRIQVRTGSLTDYLRHQWGLSKDRNESDRHHAQDAIVIACATQGMVQLLSRLSAIFENKEDFRRKEAAKCGHDKAEAWYTYIKKQIQEPWTGFRSEVLNNLEKIFVSRPPRKNATGEIHQETIRSLNPKHKNYNEKDVLSGIKIRGGLANNGLMLRTDVFVKKNKKGKDEFYLVPIYLSDMGKDLPNKAIVAHKAEEQWPELDETYQFKFSLYMDDLLKIKKGEKEILGYFNGTDRAVAAISLTSHDRSNNFRGIGVKTLDQFRKYQVDPLGRIAEVKKETRLPLTMIKKKHRHGPKKGE